MWKPSKTVSENGDVPKKSFFSRPNYINNDHENQECSNKMENSRHWFAVLTQIERVKFPESFDAFHFNSNLRWVPGLIYCFCSRKKNRWSYRSQTKEWTKTSYCGSFPLKDIDKNSNQSTELEIDFSRKLKRTKPN